MPQPGVGQDISPGGIRLRRAERLAPGLRIRVTLRVRQHLALTVLGTVVWANPLAAPPQWEVGIVFREPLSSHLFLDITDRPSLVEPRDPDPDPTGGP